MADFKKYDTNSFYTVPGRVAVDPKFLAGQGDKPALLRFKVVDSTRSDKHEDMWVEVTLSGKRAEVFQNLKKGDRVTAGGKLEMRRFENKGKEGISMEIRFPSQFALQSDMVRQEPGEDPFA
jgi:single-stranded DNA-binding protein